MGVDTTTDVDPAQQPCPSSSGVDNNLPRKGRTIGPFHHLPAYSEPCYRRARPAPVRAYRWWAWLPLTAPGCSTVC